MSRFAFLFCCLLLIIAAGCSLGPVTEDDPFTPVLTAGSPGTWDDQSVTTPHVMYDTVRSIYGMYYAGCTADGKYAIGYAESADGLAWDRPDLGSGDNICINHGAVSTWSANGVFRPWVVKVSDTAYHMWFTGVNSTGVCRIGYASSSDGLSWSIAPSAVLNPTGTFGAFDQNHVVDIAVIYQTGTFHVWYTGMDMYSNFAIGYTTTTVPSTLTNAAEPAAGLAPLAGTYFDGGFRAPTVLYDAADTKYKMWPTTAYVPEGKYYITMTQADTVTDWVVNAAPVLGDHTTGFDAIWVGFCSVIKHPSAGGFEMWYTGYSNSGYAIGYASSGSGVSWTKYMETE